MCVSAAPSCDCSCPFCASEMHFRCARLPVCRAALAQMTVPPRPRRRSFDPREVMRDSTSGEPDPPAATPEPAPRAAADVMAVVLHELRTSGPEGLSFEELAERVGVSERGSALDRLLTEGRVVRVDGYFRMSAAQKELEETHAARADLDRRLQDAEALARDACAEADKLRREAAERDERLLALAQELAQRGRGARCHSIESLRLPPSSAIRDCADSDPIAGDGSISGTSLDAPALAVEPSAGASSIEDAAALRRIAVGLGDHALAAFSGGDRIEHAPGADDDGGELGAEALRRVFYAAWNEMARSSRPTDAEGAALLAVRDHVRRCIGRMVARLSPATYGESATYRRGLEDASHVASYGQTDRPPLDRVTIKFDDGSLGFAIVLTDLSRLAHAGTHRFVLGSGHYGRLFASADGRIRELPASIHPDDLTALLGANPNTAGSEAASEGRRS